MDLAQRRDINRRACTFDFQRDAFLSNKCGMDLGARPIAHIMAKGFDFLHRVLPGDSRQTLHRASQAPTQVRHNRRNPWLEKCRGIVRKKRRGNSRGLAIHWWRPMMHFLRASLTSSSTSSSPRCTSIQPSKAHFPNPKVRTLPVHELSGTRGRSHPKDSFASMPAGLSVAEAAKCLMAHINRGALGLTTGTVTMYSVVEETTTKITFIATFISSELASISHAELEAMFIEAGIGNLDAAERFKDGSFSVSYKAFCGTKSYVVQLRSNGNMNTIYAIHQLINRKCAEAIPVPQIFKTTVMPSCNLPVQISTFVPGIMADVAYPTLSLPEKDQEGVDEYKSKYLDWILQFTATMPSSILDCVNEVPVIVTHADMGLHNMILDSNPPHDLKAIIDWEFVYCYLRFHFRCLGSLNPCFPTPRRWRPDLNSTEQKNLRQHSGMRSLFGEIC
ncbi:hypothetical protein B7494_g2769 [Chlorociboria aeruginascens]|nr:hypothetical protein B7494_g2769 [Chlorociboria aeruginascens]